MTTLTTRQITTLRREAAEAGDMVRVALCDIALGGLDLAGVDADLLETPERAVEDRWGGGGFSARDLQYLTEIVAAEDPAASARACLQS